MAITFAEWKSMTKRWGVKRSRALRDVDDAFEAYELNPSQNRLATLSQAFKTWSNTKQREETRGQMTTTFFKTSRNKTKNEDGLGAVELLRDFIRSQKVSNVVINQQVTGLTERVAIVEITGAEFTQEEGAKVQETIRVLAAAVRQTRDVVIGAARSAGADRTLYAKWFGAFNMNRCREVRDRFQILDRICASKGIVFTDGRNDATNRAAFAWAYPGNERNFPAMWLGDAFFLRANFGEGSRDALSHTLGTCVHELTHACFDTDDKDLPATDGGHLCNDPKNDCRLAEVAPDDAYANADNYGEFVVDVFSKVHFNYVWP